MKIRKNILPRRLVDILCFLVISVFTPIVFIFEMIIVLPVFHEPGGFFHAFTFVLALFLVFNIKGNMIACMIVDTSVDFASIEPPSESVNLQLTEAKKNNAWRWCERCEKLAPPRSWHCKACKVCILKRDHHCVFTGCCIGHLNHRYFMMFVFYLFIGSTYAFVYNSIYLWSFDWYILHLPFLISLLLLTGSIRHKFYLVLYILNLVTVVHSLVILTDHVPTIIRGGVCYERSKGYPYDAGVRQNMRQLFGKRMHLIWLSPLIKSELPDDGVTWTEYKKELNNKKKLEFKSNV